MGRFYEEDMDVRDEERMFEEWAAAEEAAAWDYQRAEEELAWASLLASEEKDYREITYVP